MDVYGSTSKITKQLSDQKLLIKAYGTDKAKRIQQRIFEFSNATNLSQISHVPPPRLHSLKGDMSELFAVDISANWRIVFEGYDKNDVKSTKESDIVTVQIIGIEDYH